jgi:hypothetical protein
MNHTICSGSDQHVDFGSALVLLEQPQRRRRLHLLPQLDADAVLAQIVVTNESTFDRRGADTPSQPSSPTVGHDRHRLVRTRMP